VVGQLVVGEGEPAIRRLQECLELQQQDYYFRVKRCFAIAEPGDCQRRHENARPAYGSGWAPLMTSLAI